MTHPPRRTLLTLTLMLAAGLATAQPAPPSAASPVLRLRGTVQSVAPGSLTLKERSGETIALALTDKLVVSEVYPITLSDIQPGSFIGTAALPQPDGRQRAIAITVFPESARGTGEGHRPFDLQPQSTMTNATVGDVTVAPNGRTMQLKYKGGEQTLTVPPGTPVVTFRPGDRSLLVPGASVSMTAQAIDDKPTALRINAGRGGFVLPY